MIGGVAGGSKSSEHGAMQSGSFEVVEIKKILFVDDEPALARLVVKVLARDYEVVTAPSAEDALDRLKRGERFDAILADLHLPGMTGEDFLKRLDTLDPPFAGSVAFVTGGVDSPEDAGFLRSVPNPHLGKPFEIDELRGFVAALLANEPVVSIKRRAGS
jgi:CheY-like chemotaxis protein